MHTITGDTTLGELAVLRAKFGVRLIAIDFNPSGQRLHACLAALTTEEFVVTGIGETEIEALDDAFARLQHRIGEVVAAESEATS